MKNVSQKETYLFEVFLLNGQPNNFAQQIHKRISLIGLLKQLFTLKPLTSVIAKYIIVIYTQE